MCLVPVREHADSIRMMTVPTTTIRIDLDPALDVVCAGCGQVRLAMINGVCVSCVLDGMGAGADNRQPRVYAPNSRERFDCGIQTDVRIAAR
jgi:hypothetical protein